MAPFRGASSTLMQEIAQGYGPHVVVATQYLLVYRGTAHFTCRTSKDTECQLLTTILANISMKSCQVYIPVSWKRKRGNGDKYTRFLFLIFPSQDTDVVIGPTITRIPCQTRI